MKYYSVYRIGYVGQVIQSWSPFTNLNWVLEVKKTQMCVDKRKVIAWIDINSSHFSFQQLGYGCETK